MSEFIPVTHRAVHVVLLKGNSAEVSYSTDKKSAASHS